MACTSKKDVKKAASFSPVDLLMVDLPAYEALAKTYKSDYTLQSLTTYSITPIDGQTGETRTHQVDVSANQAGEWQLSYALQDPTHHRLQQGAALWKAQQFYRRLPDQPWIHRAPESGEWTAIRAAHNETKALFSLLRPWIGIATEPTASPDLSLLRWQLTKNQPSTYQSDLVVENLEGEIGIEKKTGTPVSVTLHVVWRVHRADQPPIRVQVTHRQTIKKVSSVSLQTPETFQENPMRNRQRSGEAIRLLKPGS